MGKEEISILMCIYKQDDPYYFSAALESIECQSKFFEELILVTPGIRLPEDSKNDQKRTETPGMAVKNGSSLLIIGRTITKSTNPISSIERIIQNIENEI